MNDSEKLILIRKIIDNAWEFGNESGDFLNGILCALEAVMQVKEKSEDAQ